MGLLDIKDFYEFKIDDIDLKIEFDFESIGMVELTTGKNIYKVYELLDSANISTLDLLNTFCAGLTKNHNDETLQAIRKTIQGKMYLLPEVKKATQISIMKPLLKPETYYEIYKDLLPKVIDEKKPQETMQNPKEIQSTGTGTIQQQ